MTVGQWLLDFYWNNAVLLEGFNKWGGVLMAAIGAVLVAPQGSKHLWVTITKPLTQTGSFIRNLSLRLLRRSRSATVYAPSAASKAGITDQVTVTLHQPWMDEYTLDQKVKWLKDRVERVDADWRARAADLDAVDQRTKLDLRELERRTFDETARLQSQINNIQDDAVRIDATGLPPIVAGIFLTGVPEELATYGAFGWMVWIGMATITVVAVARSIKSNIWT